MNPARPLRDIFADPVDGSPGADAAGPAEVLRAAGHPDLPDSLVAEAVGSYADTAPIEVAEHLSPYVMAHSPIPLPDQADVEPAQWLDVVSTAPTVTAGTDDPLLGLDDPQAPPDLDHSGPADQPGDDHLSDDHLGDAIDFGHTGPGGGFSPLSDGPDLPEPVDTGAGYDQPDQGPDIPREPDDIHHLDDPSDDANPDDLDTWDDA